MPGPSTDVNNNIAIIKSTLRMSETYKQFTHIFVLLILITISRPNLGGVVWVFLFDG